MMVVWESTNNLPLAHFLIENGVQDGKDIDGMTAGDFAKSYHPHMGSGQTFRFVPHLMARLAVQLAHISRSFSSEQIEFLPLPPPLNRMIFSNI